MPHMEGYKHGAAVPWRERVFVRVKQAGLLRINGKARPNTAPRAAGDGACCALAVCASAITA